ncbi:TetR family transcriptional regulator [Amycolatopsis sulphurea]|uniref:TetR family transcriptional regulator n=1 Tax=Amycolatopsis sulphurea TaxID=76022 RepID=A0A2A9G3K2_9PSEU|nr:TetR/AcrR family transcriptional regulator [Amycolatopsis sulphurea]PFG57229.1 TetR family transcriptional regulator [Amycolatopsis sulphurea]
MDLASEPPVRGRRRHGAELEGALLDAAWDELMERGYSGLTFESVAGRAGTSRPVVNRRWATKGALVQDAILRASDRGVLTDPATGSLRDDTIDLMEQLNVWFAGFAAIMTAQLAAYFDELGTSPADLREMLTGSRQSVIETVLQRAIDRGEIDGAKLTPRIAGLPYDLLRHEAIMHLRPMSSESIREVVDTIFMPLVR